MGAEEHDIVARISRSEVGSSSTGALAAHLARSCGHVLVDGRVIQQGYRYHTELGDEIPAFFNKRMSTGSTNIAITLQAGFDPENDACASGPFTDRGTWSTDPFSECQSTADARGVIEADDYHASIWLARITIGFDLLDVGEVAQPLFIAQHPNEFRAVAEELVAVGIVQGHACPLCGD